MCVRVGLHMCMCARVCMCVRVCVCMCALAGLCMCMCARVRLCVYVCVRLFVRACMRVVRFLWVYVCVHVQMYFCACARFKSTQYPTLSTYLFVAVRRIANYLPLTPVAILHPFMLLSDRFQNLTPSYTPPKVCEQACTPTLSNPVHPH